MIPMTLGDIADRHRRAPSMAMRRCWWTARSYADSRDCGPGSLYVAAR